MPAILEDVVAYMQSKPNPADASHQYVLFTEGLVDLTNRLRNLEHLSLSQDHKMSVAETRLSEAEAKVAGVEADRADHIKRLSAVEKAPAESAKKHEDLEKRVRTVEGAVGSTGYKAAKEAKPVVGATPVSPVAPIT